MDKLNPILQVSQVSYRTSVTQQTLLDNLSFEVNQGDRIGIVGMSGSGKSTLLRLLNRLIDPTSGKILFQNKPLTDYPVTHLRQQILLVPQEPKLLGMTVQETLSYPLQLQQLSASEIKQSVIEYCELFSIPDDWLERNELQLSVGQRQWVTLVRGMILKPRILLLDEPTSALDMGLAHQLLEKLNILCQDQKLTVIIVNHQLPWMGQFANQILHLKSGKIMQYSDAHSIDWDTLQKQLISQHQEEDWIT
ncbi:MAG: ATP-binding cassette domain-containing protein [Microcystaceae cyanobacterium]